MITLILGGVGSGKTLLMTVFSQLSNRNVFSNFQIRKSNKTIEVFKIRDILDEKISKSDVYIDEFYLYMDSRHFMSDINSLLSYFAFQSRKLDLRIYLSTQIIRTIDVRMREMIDNIIECERQKNGFLYTIYADIKNNNLSPPKQLFLSNQSAAKFYGLYDTYEVIKTPLFEQIKRNVAIAEFSEAEKEQIAKNSVVFLKQNNLKITKTNIAVFCQKNSYATKKEFVNDIYASAIICSVNPEPIGKKKKVYNFQKTN